MVGDDQNGCLPWVKGRLGDYVSITAGVPRIAADLLQRPSWQSRAITGHSRTVVAAFRFAPAETESNSSALPAQQYDPFSTARYCRMRATASELLSSQSEAGVHVLTRK